MTTMAELEKSLITTKNANLDMRPGDTVRVHVRITEGDKSRIQIFEGTIIGLKRAGPRSSFTVRKISHGVGVERIFPLHSPVVEQIEVRSRHEVRRAKLYYLRALQGKKARLREIRGWRPNNKVDAPAAADPTDQQATT